MKELAQQVKNIVLSVLVQRLAGWAVDQYVMPQIEKLPTKKSKPFGFAG